MKGVALHSFAALLVTCGAFLTKSWWEGSSTEFTVAVVAILIAGVPHGSLDHEVEGRTSKKFQLLRFLVMYIIVAFIYLGVWMIWPGIAFIIFLLITAWHFGETDFHSFQLKNHNPSLLFLYGISITLWLLVQEKETLLHWTNIITQGNSLATVTVEKITSISPYWWYITLAIILVLNNEGSKKSYIASFFFLLFVFLLSYTTLLIGFVIYFTGWHSLHALQHIRMSAFKTEHFKVLVKKALFPTVGALVFLGAIVWLGNKEWMQIGFLPAIFILLSILTLPHMLVMHRMYEAKKVEVE